MAKGIITHDWLLLHTNHRTNPTPEYVLRIGDCKVEMEVLKIETLEVIDANGKVKTTDEAVYHKEVFQLNKELFLKCLMNNSKDDITDEKRWRIYVPHKQMFITTRKNTARDKFGESKYEYSCSVEDVDGGIENFTIILSGVRRYIDIIYIDITTNSNEIIYNVTPNIADRAYNTIKYDIHLSETQNSTFSHGAMATPNPSQFRKYEVAVDTTGIVNAQGTVGMALQLSGIDYISKKKTAKETYTTNWTGAFNTAKKYVSESMGESLSFAQINTDEDQEDNHESFVKYAGDKESRLSVNKDEMSLWTFEDAEEFVEDNKLKEEMSILNKNGMGATVDEHGNIIIGDSVIGRNQIKGNIQSTGSSEERSSGFIPGVGISSNTTGDIIPQHSSFIASPKYSYHMGQLFRTITRFSKLAVFTGVCVAKGYEVDSMLVAANKINTASKFYKSKSKTPNQPPDFQKSCEDELSAEISSILKSLGR